MRSDDVRATTCGGFPWFPFVVESDVLDFTLQHRRWRQCIWKAGDTCNKIKKEDKRTAQHFILHYVRSLPPTSLWLRVEKHSLSLLKWLGHATPTHQRAKPSVRAKTNWKWVKWDTAVVVRTWELLLIWTSVTTYSFLCFQNKCLYPIKRLIMVFLPFIHAAKILLLFRQCSIKHWSPENAFMPSLKVWGICPHFMCNLCKKNIKALNFTQPQLLSVIIGLYCVIILEHLYVIISINQSIKLC